MAGPPLTEKPCTPPHIEIPYMNNTPKWIGAVTSSPIVIKEFKDEVIAEAGQKFPETNPSEWEDYIVELEP